MYFVRFSLNWLKNGANTYLPPSNLSAKKVGAVEIENEKFGIEVSPNPVTDLVKIKFNNAYGIANIKLFDLTGKLIRTSTVNLDEKEISFSLADQPEGIYLLHVNDSKTSISSKIIKK